MSHLSYDPVYSYAVDRFNNILHCNQAFENLFTQNLKPLAGKNLDQIEKSLQRPESHHLQPWSTNNRLARDSKHTTLKILEHFSGSETLFSYKICIGELIMSISFTHEVFFEHCTDGELLRLVIQKLPINLYWHKINGMIIRTNQKQAREAGLINTYGGIRFDSLSYILGKNHVQRVNDVTRTIIDEQKNWSGVENASTKNVRKYCFSMKSPVINEKTNKVDSIIGTSVDVTQLYYQLKGAERDKEKAQTEARYKSDLVLQVAHDFRNPIGAMQTFLETFDKSELSESSIEMMDYLRACCLSMGELCTKIFDQKLIENHNYQPTFKPMNIVTVVQKILDIQRPAISIAGLKLFMDISGKIPQTIKYDEVYLTKIITNLISNAVKYTKKGYIQVNVSCKDEKVNKILLHVIIEIKDTGQGMDKKTAQQLMNNMEASRIETDNYTGNGLGLQIIGYLMKQLGGFVEMETTLGKGTSFITHHYIRVEPSPEIFEDENLFSE
jgi:signal transduction histidine kinase